MISNDDLSVDLAFDRCRSSLVGFTDDLGTFQDRVLQELFPDANLEVPERQVNASENGFKPEQLTPANRKLLEELNQLDIQLYREARKRYGLVS